jgi:hypothetical protein
MQEADMCGWRPRSRKIHTNERGAFSLFSDAYPIIGSEKKKEKTLMSFTPRVLSIMSI